MGVGAAAVAVRVGSGDSSLVQLHKIKDFQSFMANSDRVSVHSGGSGQTAGGGHNNIFESLKAP